MKRRVARDHSNKRALRTLSAQHGFSHDTFQVLCDSSFLRTLLQLPECSPLGHNGQKGGTVASFFSSSSTMPHRNIGSGQTGGHSFSSNHSSVSPFILLKSLTLQALEVLDKNTGDMSASNEGKHSKQLSHIQWTYLPATERVLRHMICEKEGEERRIREKDHQILVRNEKGGTTNKKRNKDTQGLSTVRLDKLLSFLKRIGAVREEAKKTNESPAKLSEGSEQVEVPRFLIADTNEAKAISGFVEHHHQVREKEASMAHPHLNGLVLEASSSLPRSSFLFIATQSHDVRRRLPDDAALLRLTHHPSAVWVEIKREHYPHYDESSSRSCAFLMSLNEKESQEKQETKKIGKRDDGRTRRKVDASTVTPSKSVSASTRASLSPADVSFMRYLNHCRGEKGKIIGKGVFSEKETSQDSNTSRHPLKDRQNGCVDRQKSLEKETTGQSESVHPSVLARRRKRPQESHPNPLSVKKKQKKEVLRL